MTVDGESFIVLAHRLPAEHSEGAGPVLPDGLNTAVAPLVRDRGGVWIGGVEATAAEEGLEPFEFDGMRLIPVSLSSEEHERWGDGFCNATLWPLYHDLIVAPQYHRSWWSAYVSVNAKFAQAAVDTAATGATVWVHDFHLQLVPEMIRAQRPDVRIGFFNHIPFPHPEQIAQLPWRDAILTGLLGSDVIGFQREADAANFRTGVKRLLGKDTADLPCLIGAYPVSIDVDAIRTAATSSAVAEAAGRIRRELGEPETLMIGVDRIDYSNGLLHRLRAFEEMLEDGLIDAQNTCLLQVVVPSQESGRAHEDLRDEVERMIGHINGNFGTLGRDVVHYSHHSYSRDSAVAWYLAADMLLVTSLREGMNLIAKEFVTARRGLGGALVLSEFAGAADELTEAFIVNPHDRTGLKQAMHHAAALPAEEARERVDAMAATAAASDVHHWAQTFLSDLQLTPLHQL